MNDNILLLGALAIAWFFSNNKKEKYTFNEYIEQKELEGMFCELNEPITFYMTKAHLPYGEAAPLYSDGRMPVHSEAVPVHSDGRMPVYNAAKTVSYAPQNIKTSTLPCAAAVEVPSRETSRFKHVPYIPRYNDQEFFNGLEHHTVTNSSAPVNVILSGYESRRDAPRSRESPLVSRESACPSETLHSVALPYGTLNSAPLAPLESARVPLAPRVYEQYHPEVSLEYLNFRHPLAATKTGPLGFSSGEYSVATSGNSKPGYKTMGDLGVHKPEESMLDYISRSTFDVDVRNHAYTLDYLPSSIMNYHDSVDYYNDATLRHRASIQDSAMNMQNKFAHLRQMYPMYRHSQINRGQQMF